MARNTRDSLKLVEILKNPTTQEVRVVFTYEGYGGQQAIRHIAVKVWDLNRANRNTIKFFNDSYESIKSHWRTIESVELGSTVALHLEAVARDIIGRTLCALMWDCDTN